MLDNIFGIISVGACAYLAHTLGRSEFATVLIIIGVVSIFLAPYSMQTPVTRAAACMYTAMVAVPLAVVSMGLFGSPNATSRRIYSMFVLVFGTIVTITFGASVLVERFVYFALSAQAHNAAEMIAEHRAT